MYYESGTITPIGAPLAMFCAGITTRLGAKLSEGLGSRIVLSVAMGMAIIATFVSSQTDNFGSNKNMIELSYYFTT